MPAERKYSIRIEDGIHEIIIHKEEDEELPISFARELKKIGISRTGLSLEEAFNSLIGQNIRGLALYFCPTSHEEVEAFNNVLLTNKEIEILTLQNLFKQARGADFNAQTIQYLDDFLQRTQHLRKLDLSENIFGPENLAMIFSHLPASLHYLNCRGGLIDRNSAQELAKYLMFNRNIFYLDISSCRLGTEGAQEILPVLESNMHSLSYLKIIANGLEEGELQRLQRLPRFQLFVSTGMSERKLAILAEQKLGAMMPVALNQETLKQLVLRVEIGYTPRESLEGIYNMLRYSISELIKTTNRNLPEELLWKIAEFTELGISDYDKNSQKELFFRQVITKTARSHPEIIEETIAIIARRRDKEQNKYFGELLQKLEHGTGAINIEKFLPWQMNKALVIFLSSQEERLPPNLKLTHNRLVRAFEAFGENYDLSQVFKLIEIGFGADYAQSIRDNVISAQTEARIKAESKAIEEKLEKESQDLEARIKADSKRLSQQSPAVKNPTSKPLKKDSELSLESK